MATYSSSSTDRGYENIFNPKKIYGSVDNPAYIPRPIPGKSEAGPDVRTSNITNPINVTPSTTTHHHQGATTTYETFNPEGVAIKTVAITATGAGGAIVESTKLIPVPATPEYYGDTSGRGYSIMSENVYKPTAQPRPSIQQPSPFFASGSQDFIARIAGYAPRTINRMETNVMPFQSQEFPVFDFGQKRAPGFGGTITAYRKETPKGSARFPNILEQWYYESSKKSQDLLSGNQYQYAAGAALGFGIGVLKFGTDISSDILPVGRSEAGVKLRIPLTTTATNIYKLATDIPSGLKNIGQQFVEKPYESAGYYIAPGLFAKGLEGSRDVFVRAVTTEQPATELLDIRALKVVEEGGKTYPHVGSIEELQQAFLRGREMKLDFNYGQSAIPESYAIPQASIAEQIRSQWGRLDYLNQLLAKQTKSTPGDVLVVSQMEKPFATFGLKTVDIKQPQLGSGESAGVYVSPYGLGNPSFYHIFKSDKIQGFSLFPKISRPTTALISVPIENVIRTPTSVLKLGVGFENTWLGQQFGKLVVPTGNVERYFREGLGPGATKREAEGLIPAGGFEPTGGVLGYSKRMEVSGQPVPIRTYRLTEGGKLTMAEITPKETFKWSPTEGKYVYEQTRTLAASDISSAYLTKMDAKRMPYIESPDRLVTSYRTSGKTLGYSNMFPATSSYNITTSKTGSRSIALYEKFYIPELGYTTGRPSRSVYSYQSLITETPSIPRPQPSSYYPSGGYTYNYPKLTPTPLVPPPTTPIYRERYESPLFKKRKIKANVYKPKATKWESYILPDLMSVSRTEFALFPKGQEAIAPRATPKIRELSTKAFSGYSFGFVPTEQMRIKLKL